MDRCKTLFLIPTLTSGGAERVVVTLLRHLDRSRFDLALGVVDVRNAVFRNDVPEDVAFFDLASPRVRYVLPRVARLVKSMRPDVVFSTLGHLNLALALIKPLLPPKTRVIGRETIVVSEAVRSLSWPGPWKLAYKRLYRRLDRVICQSRDMQEDLVRNFRVPVEKTSVIHNPVDVEYIRGRSLDASSVGYPSPAAEGTLRFVAAGRLVYQKGFDLLLEAVALCRDISMQLAILGEGPLELELAQQALRLGVQDRVRFVGYQENPYAWFGAADAFLLSSRYEGLSNVMLEALACGTPLIATPAPGGTTEVLSAIPQCEIADDVSAPALARAIRRWISRRPSRVPETAVAPYAVGPIMKAYESELLALACP